MMPVAAGISHRTAITTKRRAQGAAGLTQLAVKPLHLFPLTGGPHRRLNTPCESLTQTGFFIGRPHQERGRRQEAELGLEPSKNLKGMSEQTSRRNLHLAIRAT